LKVPAPRGSTIIDPIPVYVFTSGQTVELTCGGFSSGTGDAPYGRRPALRLSGASARASDQMLNLELARNMDTASSDGMPSDVLVVEDDPIIALDFEDTILGFGVKTVRTAANVAKALDMIADRPPEFALLDVSLIREKSFAVAERLEALKIPFAFVTGYGADTMLPAAFAAKPRLPKPYSTDALRALLKSVCICRP
jgi:CheY-like chemotaxis protein